MYVTVGYIPTFSSTDFSFSAATEPTKYMDYVFSRGENRKWYLTAMQESEMKPAATATPVPTEAAGAMDTQSMVEENLDSTMTDIAGIDPNASPDPEEPAPEEQGGEEQPAEENTGEQPPAEYPQ